MVMFHTYLKSPEENEWNILVCVYIYIHVYIYMEYNGIYTLMKYDGDI